MPVQTTSKNFLFPDGCQVLVKETGAGSYTDLGAINSQVSNTINFDENQIETANAGTTEKQINNMKVEGSFTLINWDMSVLEKISGGVLTNTATLAAANTDIPVQSIAGGWTEHTLYDLDMQTSATDSTALRMSVQPTLTTVKIDIADADEALTEGSDYNVVANANSSSGWSIQFSTTAIVVSSPTTLIITIDYGSNTPIASETLNAGASTVILNPMAFRFKHTDENGAVRQLDLHSVDPNSGFLQFNFKGANEDGLEELPITYMAKLDSSLTSGHQLFSFLYEANAQ